MSNSSTVSPPGFVPAKAARLIRERGLLGILFTSPENVFYTTGAHTLPGTGNPILYALRNHVPTFSFVDAQGRVTLFVWVGATLGVSYAAQDVRTFIDSAGASEELASFLSEERGKGGSSERVGLESSCPYWAIDRIEAASGRENVVLADEVPSELRLTKSRRELELLRESARIAEETVRELGRSIRVGISRRELAQEARRLMMEHGATAVDHLTMAFGASNPEVMLDERLAERQLVTIDLGAVFEGYVSDNRRLFYSAASVPDETEKLHATIIRIVDSVGDALRPGTTFAELYSKAAGLYEKEGLSPLFFQVGHSIGIQTEEAWMTPESELRVEENMVLNVELYAPDERGVMIGDEETYVVGDGGSPERITTLPREIATVAP